MVGKKVGARSEEQSTSELDGSEVNFPARSRQNDMFQNSSNGKVWSLSTFRTENILPRKADQTALTSTFPIFERVLEKKADGLGPRVDMCAMSA